MSEQPNRELSREEVFGRPNPDRKPFRLRPTPNIWLSLLSTTLFVAIAIVRAFTEHGWIVWGSFAIAGVSALSTWFTCRARLKDVRNS